MNRGRHATRLCKRWPKHPPLAALEPQTAVVTQDAAALVVAWRSSGSGSHSSGGSSSSAAARQQHFSLVADSPEAEREEDRERQRDT